MTNREDEFGLDPGARAPASQLWSTGGGINFPALTEVPASHRKEWKPLLVLLTFLFALFFRIMVYTYVLRKSTGAAGLVEDRGPDGKTTCPHLSPGRATSTGPAGRALPRTSIVGNNSRPNSLNHEFCRAAETATGIVVTAI